MYNNNNKIRGYQAMYKIYDSDDLLLYMTKDDAEAIHYVDSLADNCSVNSYVIDDSTNELVYKRSVRDNGHKFISW